MKIIKTNVAVSAVLLATERTLGSEDVAPSDDFMQLNVKKSGIAPGVGDFGDEFENGDAALQILLNICHAL